MSGVNKFAGKVQVKSIMLSADKDTNILDNKKEEVVTTPLLEKKLLTTEKVKTSDEVHKHTENITTIEEVHKRTGKVHKPTENITTSEEVYKGSEKLEDMKEVVVTICGKGSYKFESQSKGYTVWFNLDHEFLKESFLRLNRTSI